MIWIKELIIGFIIGSGLILPGVSGGVLAVIFGIYDKMIRAISRFFDDWKKNLLFLSPIILGIMLGVFFFGNILNIIFHKYPMEAKYIFIGLILGGLPIIFAKIKEGGSRINLKVFYIALVIACLLYVLANHFIGGKVGSQVDSGISGFITLFLAGFLYVSGKVIPGLSGSFLLMLIGMYEYVLYVISSFFSLTIAEYYQFFPMFLGMVVGGLLLIRIIEYILNNYHNTCYSATLGFVIGSIIILYPGITFNMTGFISIILFLFAFLISYAFSVKNSY